MGASLALAGLTACTKQPAEKIVPYVKQPEERGPGPAALLRHRARATTATRAGVLVESHKGRPTKIEGNPDHPAVARRHRRLRPGRDPRPLRPRPLADGAVLRARSAPGPSFRAALRDALAHAEGQGRARACASSPAPSPRPRWPPRCRRCSRSFPEAQWHTYEPAGRDNARAGARPGLRRAGRARSYHFDQADVILSLDADFVGSGPGEPAAHPRVRDAAARSTRRARPDDEPALRGRGLAHRSPAPWPTTGWPLRSSEIEGFARAVAAGLGLAGRGRDGRPTPTGWARSSRTCQTHAGEARLVIAGESQPPAVHALAHAINETLGARRARPSSTPRPSRPTAEDQAASLRDAGRGHGRRARSRCSSILGGNPAYDAPADLAIRRGPGQGAACASTSASTTTRPRSAATGTCRRRTPSRPGATRAPPTARSTILQPLIAPLYGGTSAPRGARRASWAGRSATGYDLVRGRTGSGASSARRLREALAAGAPRRRRRRSTALARRSRSRSCRLGDWATGGRDAGGRGPRDRLPRPIPAVFDGRFANNGWLQELPKPAHQADLGQRGAS